MNEMYMVEPEPFNLAEAWFLFFKSIAESEPMAYYGALGFIFIVVIALLRRQRKKLYQFEIWIYLISSAVSLLFLPYFLYFGFVLIISSFLAYDHKIRWGAKND